MQTIEQYKEYTAQLEGEIKNWHDAYNASQEHVRQLMKENERLERERVEQNAIIETCANELEELRKHELQWDLDKAKIKELNAENESLKYSVATLETDLAMSQRWRKVIEELPKDGSDVLATDGEEIWLCYKTTMTDGSYWFQPNGQPHIEGVSHWMPLPKAPED